MGRDGIWKGCVAGMAGGLAGATVMGLTHPLWGKVFGGGKEARQRQEENQDSTALVASNISEKLFHHELTGREKKIAGPLVHYSFGTAVGAIYGIVADMWPRASKAYGLPFGGLVYVKAHALIVPALGWS